MREPRAHPLGDTSGSGKKNAERPPRAFSAPTTDEPIADLNAESGDGSVLIVPTTARPRWVKRTIVTAGGVLLSLSLWLAADALVRDLFARQPWLGWVGFAAAILLGLGLLVFVAREIRSIWRLASIDRLRADARKAHADNLPHGGSVIRQRIAPLYAHRADLARARAELDTDWSAPIDGIEQLALIEQTLMQPLDERAKILITNAARRVAIVTAISPRALVDIAYVGYESLKLARAIASLYGARPGFFGSWRLAGTILSHLAITGGVALGDSIVQQLLGQGLAARLSARLGEGVVNGLMTVRVGIAAMRVTRPLPFESLPQPQVMEFMAELAKIASAKNDEPEGRI